MKLVHKNLLLVAIVVAISVVPMVMHRDSSFVGTDDAAVQTAEQLGSSVVQSADGGESVFAQHEGLIRAIQAALGAGIIGYYFGYQRGKKMR